MKPMGLPAQRELSWFTIRAFPRRAFELRSEDSVVGTVWEPALRREGHAIAWDGEWIFRGPHFLDRRIAVFVKDPIRDVALLDLNWRWRGTLRFSDGRSFLWNPTKGLDRIFATSAGVPLLRTWTSFQFLEKSVGRVQIEPAAASLNELSLLVLLSWYTIMAEPAAV